MALKAYYAYLDGEEWGTLVHGETRGKAKSAFWKWNPGAPLDWGLFTEIRLRRYPGMDDKPFTYENAAAAGFHYQDYDREADEDGNHYLPPEDFTNDCHCPICKGDQK